MNISLYSNFLFLILPFCAMTQNVGIGTASPDQKLVVEGGQIKLQNSQKTKFLHIRTDGSEVDITTIGSHFWITASKNKHIVLNPNHASIGNIGIGTYNPTEKLDVAGGARIQSLIGEGNRILYTTSTGILAASTLSISELQDNQTKLQRQINEQTILIDTLLERLEKFETFLEEKEIKQKDKISG